MFNDNELIENVRRLWRSKSKGKTDTKTDTDQLERDTITFDPAVNLPSTVNINDAIDPNIMALIGKGIDHIQTNVKTIKTNGDLYGHPSIDYVSIGNKNETIDKVYFTIDKRDIVGYFSYDDYGRACYCSIAFRIKSQIDDDEFELKIYYRTNYGKLTISKEVSPAPKYGRFTKMTQEHDLEVHMVPNELREKILRTIHLVGDMGRMLNVKEEPLNTNKFVGNISSTKDTGIILID